MRKFFITGFLLLSLTLASYSYGLDSLINVLNTKYANNPKQALSFIEKIYNRAYKSNPQQVIEIIGRAIYLSDSVLHDYEQGEQWKFRLALVYMNIGQLDQAIRYMTEVKDYYYKHHQKLKYAQSLMYIGEIYYKLKVPEIAIDDYKKALAIFKEKGQTDLVALVNAKIAKIYYDDYKTQQAYSLLFNTLDSLQMRTSTKAVILSELGDFYTSDLQLDSALIFYNRALLQLRGLKGVQFDIAQLYKKIGNILVNKNNISDGLKKFDSALVIAKNIGATQLMAEIYSDIAAAYYKQKDYANAEKYFLMSINKARLVHASLVLQKDYYFLAKIYEEQKKLDLAISYYRQYIKERNKYFESITSQSYAEVILMFQNEEKMKEIELLRREENLKTQQLRFLLAIVVLLLILVAVVVIMMRKLRRANKLLEKQYQQIMLQKRELMSQSKILEKATQDLLRQKERIEKQNRDISASIKYASRIQRAMLPKPELFAKYFDDFFIYYRPKETVSGDFYWLAEVRPEKPSLFQEEINTKIILAVADCTGHGVPGAFMAMLGDAYLNQIIKIQHIYAPDKILNELNRNIRDTLHQEDSESTDGMDIAICVIDKQERSLDFAGAKIDLIYVQDEKMVRVHGDIFSIGGLKQERDKEFTMKRIDITAPTLFYLYSDGFQDQFGGKYGRKYMAKRFREFLYKIHSLPMEEQKKELDREFKRWKGKKYPQMDDITVIGIYLKGKYDEE